eukprot:TRINITY_DN11401_c0_g1_i5.p1 TRINITY_DN11401_c0_g1~~TRINITY_DN11401_c0_g1_i5.p1  ORF type:complete len:196 (+),score=37.95 TRINITY_DN11401_c0_g1_i5:52-639(+)
MTQIQHCFQTAERARELFPEDDWLHLTGLIHDLGKVLAHPDIGLDQWAVVGDTFPVGCAHSDRIVLSKFFNDNQDSQHQIYSTKNGVYDSECGLDNLTMSWGHDEYMYQVLMNHPECTLPVQGLFCIRFHSFYAWHREREYTYFETDHDRQMLDEVLKFNKCDLYSKSAPLIDIDSVKDYYQALIDKYCPGDLNW